MLQKYLTMMLDVMVGHAAFLSFLKIFSERGSNPGSFVFHIYFQAPLSHRGPPR